MLEDFENYEYKTAHVGNYENLTFFFISTTLLITINRVIEYFNSPTDIVSFSEFMSLSFLIYPSLILLAISFFFYLASRRYLIRISGKFSHIEFRVRNPRKKSLNKFLKAVVDQSMIIKKQSSRLEPT